MLEYFQCNRKDRKTFFFLSNQQLRTRVYVNDRNNNDVEVVKFATSENQPFQVYYHIAAFVNALELYVI
jgi:hypothetical protein